MRRIEQTNQFKRDFKKIATSGRYKKKDFLDVVELLIHDKPLPEKYRDHALYNNWIDQTDACDESNKRTTLNVTSKKLLFKYD